MTKKARWLSLVTPSLASSGARPTALESVGKVKERLLAEIQREFCVVSDIVVEHGHSSRGGFVRVIHGPTGINSGFQIVSQTSTSEAQVKALDEVVGEVWRRKMEDNRNSR